LSATGRSKRIVMELARHAPFTALGALLGATLMLAIAAYARELTPGVFYEAFHVLYPAHILLSAIVTSSLFRLYRGSATHAAVVGFTGAVGVCTVSDVLLPYVGGWLLGVEMELHLCLVVEPWTAVLPALVGSSLGALTGRWTRCPHAAHVSVSTLASLSYLAAFGVSDGLPLVLPIFAILFVSVWTPCCASDIVLPLLFARELSPASARGRGSPAPKAPADPPAGGPTGRRRYVSSDFFDLELYAVYRAAHELVGEETWKIVWRVGEIVYERIKEEIGAAKARTPAEALARVLEWLKEVGYVEDAGLREVSAEEIEYTMLNPAILLGAQQLISEDRVPAHVSTAIMFAALGQFGLRAEIVGEPEFLPGGYMVEKWRLVRRRAPSER